ncbi:MAG TPA: response regulator [Verrucomicrobiae bacterium]|jgi:CheY-like chemotaxis protein|nr:response regulator [Verrucomicrobiae bacterium]
MNLILLAEDSHEDEKLFKRVMRAGRLENPLMVVRNGAEAIAYLGGEGPFAERDLYPAPDILFLDLKMPQVSGFEVLEWLRGRTGLKQKLLVIVLSNFGDTQAITRAYRLGADSFLSKPIKRQDFLNLVQHFPGRWLSLPLEPAGASAGVN